MELFCNPSTGEWETKFQEWEGWLTLSKARERSVEEIRPGISFSITGWTYKLQSCSFNSLESFPIKPNTKFFLILFLNMWKILHIFTTTFHFRFFQPETWTMSQSLRAYLSSHPAYYFQNIPSKDPLLSTSYRMKPQTLSLAFHYLLKIDPICFSASSKTSSLTKWWW